MTAPVAGSAKVASTGDITPLGVQPTPDEVVTPEDADDPAKLAQILGRLLKSVADLRRQWSPRNLDYEDVPVAVSAGLSSLQHALAGRVRWWVNGWRTDATPTTDILLGSRLLWIQRALWGALTVGTSATNLTLGNRFQCTTPCSIMGVRFLWASATRTVKATLWRDSDGAVLGTGTVAVTTTGVYTVVFAIPVAISGADLNVDLTVGIHDQAATAVTVTGADAVFSGYLPMALPGLLLKSIRLNVAGDARPTSNLATNLCWIEPLLTPAQPQLIEDATSTEDRLVLRSYVPGQATVRIEEGG